MAARVTRIRLALLIALELANRIGLDILASVFIAVAILDHANSDLWARDVAIIVSLQFASRINDARRRHAGNALVYQVMADHARARVIQLEGRRHPTSPPQGEEQPKEKTA